MARDYDDWEDDSYEPGYDPGPSPCEDCDARCCEDCEHGDGDGLIDGVGFADPGGRSALRAETRDNPRILPCPNCGAPDVLTPADRARGYQCDRCADLAERGGW